MLVYKRRGSSETIENLKINLIPNARFLGYCNWSYAKNFHLNSTEAISMFNNFKSIYIPYYVRIFNEIPRSVLFEFTERNHISYSSIEKIHRILINKTSFRIKNI